MFVLLIPKPTDGFILYVFYWDAAFVHKGATPSHAALWWPLGCLEHFILNFIKIGLHVYY